MLFSANIIDKQIGLSLVNKTRIYIMIPGFGTVISTSNVGNISCEN